MESRPFVPERYFIDEDFQVITVPPKCLKEQTHKNYHYLKNLTLENLPEGWRKETVLQDLKMVARRVVHLTVVKLSPSRGPLSKIKYSSGSGFITFHPKYGAIINTSKHVVYDPFEARHTIIRPFYEDNDNIRQDMKAMEQMKDQIIHEETQCGVTPNLVLFRGSDNYFRSVMASDYTAFSCEPPLHTFFTTEEVELSNPAFSWWKFSLRRLVFVPQIDIDVAVISHPHSEPKQISFGKMSRLINLVPALYDAATCPGSSGAPVIRLDLDSTHYISAGQFVHHGYCKEVLDLAMGTVRPPIAFPYWEKLDTNNKLCEAINILYEPVLYWTLFICDFLYLEGTLRSSLDVFAYTSSFAALLLSTNCLLFKILFIGFWMHISVSTICSMRKAGFRFALCEVMGTLIRMSQFLVAWTFLCFPWPFSNIFVVIAVWIFVLYLERFFFISSRFTKRTIGSFPEVIKRQLANELKIKTKRSGHDLILTTNDQ
ncbi:unnamed protein product [Lymnaea stagnalis]|uniref:Serine protease n=1 Tax=Lymnaea stagnalis TaxID=6523 RepID=A0AAV2HL01_LYMST